MNTIRPVHVLCAALSAMLTLVAVQFAVAQNTGDSWQLRPSGTLLTVQTQTTDVTFPQPLFVLEPGGCLRGPLHINDPSTRRVAFALAAGAEYPSGCSKPSN